MKKLNVTHAVPLDVGPAIDVSFEERMTAGGLMASFSVLALVTNLSLWIVVLRDKALHTTANYLLLCMSMSNILMACVPMSMNAWTILEGERKFSDDVCRLVDYVNLLSLSATVICLGAISVNRYVRVCRPDSYEGLYTRLGFILNILAIWGISALLSLPPVLWKKPSYVDSVLCTGNCEVAFEYCASTGLILIEGTMLLIIILYVNIFTEFRQLERALGVAPEEEFNPDVQKPIPYTPRLSAWSLLQQPIDKGQKSWWMRRVSRVFPAWQSTRMTSIIRNDDDSASVVHTSAAIPSKASGSVVKNDTAREDPEIASDVVVTKPSSDVTQPRESMEGDQPRASIVALPRRTKVRQSVSFLGLAAETEAQRQEKLEQKKKERDERKKKKRTGKHRKWTKDEKDVSRTIVCIIVTFILCYMPVWLVLLVCKRYPEGTPDQVIGSAWLLVYMNTLINPIIYGVRNPNIKEGYKRTFSCCCCFGSNADDE